MKFFWRSLVCLFFIMSLNLRICYANTNYNVGLDFESLLEKDIKIGGFKHIKNDGAIYEENASPLIWIVKKVDNENKKLLLVNKYVVDKMAYNNYNKSDWYSSEIKSWLENDFVNSFNETEKKCISDLSLAYFEEDKIFIDTDCELNDLGTTCKNSSKFENWWTKTSVKANSVVYIKGAEIKTIGSFAKTSNFIKPCMNFDFSDVIYFSNGERFSFVAGESIGILEKIENKKIGFGEKLSLNLQTNGDKIDSVGYKIISDEKMVCYGESKFENEILFDTDKLDMGSYQVYVWLQKNNLCSSETSEPQNFLLTVEESNPEIDKISFSSLVHRKNFAKDICIDINGKNFKADDKFEIKFFDDAQKEKLCASKIISHDENKVLINIKSRELEKLCVGKYFVKVDLTRGNKILVEKNFEYAVSDLPIISEIILSSSEFNISFGENKVSFEIKFDEFEKDDEIISGNAFIFDKDLNKISQTDNFIYDQQKNCFGDLNLPDKILTGSYKIGVDFKVKNKIIGDECKIFGSSQNFCVVCSKLSNPQFNLQSGKYFSPQEIILNSVENADIFYTLDETIPDESSKIYTVPFKFGIGNYILKAVAIKKGYEKSEIATVNYEMILQESSCSKNNESENRNDDDEKIVVKNNNGKAVKIESKKFSDGTIFLLPTKQNLIDLADENKNVNLNLDELQNITVNFGKEVISDISNDFSSVQISLKNFGAVTFANDFLKNFMNKNVSVEILHGSFVVNIRVDEKNYFDANYKSKFDANFHFVSKNNFQKNCFVIFKYVDGKKEIVSQCFYDDVNKLMKFKTNSSGKFDVLYNNVDFKDTNDLAVKFLAARKIVNGTGQNKFFPHNKIKRADFLIMFMRSFDIKIENDLSDNFFDCRNKYFSSYTATAKKLKLINGVGENKFEPEKFLTYSDMLNIGKKICDMPNLLAAQKNFVSRLDATKFLFHMLNHI